jgi:hypothetical protein
MNLSRNFWRGLLETEAATAPDAQDPRLRGRTYAIPFEQVWRAALAVIDALPRCSLAHADDRDGHIEADGATLVRRRRLRVEIDIILDEDAQTRVDARVQVEAKWGDMGVGPRWIGRFFRRLDATLARRQQAARAER